MVLYLIGLGLGDENDITLKGLQAVRSCSHVFLEHYTAILTGVSQERLQSAYGLSVPIITADREMVESRADDILTPALHSNVAFLVVGDPFASAATASDSHTSTPQPPHPRLTRFPPTHSLCRCLERPPTTTCSCARHLRVFAWRWCTTRPL